jgi:hypothetical protein
MDTLVTRLTGRLDEDERIAREAALASAAQAILHHAHPRCV